MNSRLTLIGLYNYDNRIFERLHLPEACDKDTFIETLLLHYGECPVLYSNGDFMRDRIAAWSARWFKSFERIFLAWNEEYNPLHNYDRHEQYTDTFSNTGQQSGRTETQTSAYNESTYQPQDLTTGSNTDTNNGTNTHTAHLFGNIGTTKSTEMLIDEMEARSQYNPYDIMSDAFRDDFILYVY